MEQEEMGKKLDAGNPQVTLSSNILDVVVPKEMETAVATGWPHVDALCAGDGIIPSTVLMLTGMPGAGKTTLALQLADFLTGMGHVVLYNTGEESLYQVGRTIRRLGLKNGFVPSYETEVGGLIEKATELKRLHPGKQVFLFQDSLQTLEVERDPKAKGRPSSGQNMSVVAAWRVAAWAKKNYGIAILVGQVTKDGTFAGRQEIKHAVDCHLHLHVDTDRKSESYGERIAEMEKNRFGVAGLLYRYEINRQGIQFETDAPRI